MRPSTSTPSRAERGISLVEVLIALVVLAFGVLAVGRMFPAGSRAQVQDHLLTGANNLAREKVEDLSSLAWGDTALTTGRHPGGTASEAIGNNGEWKRFYQVTAMSAPLDNLKKVDVTVSYGGAGLSGQRTVVASTYLRR
jgi:Tfp pilus assembly protein PilV